MKRRSNRILTYALALSLALHLALAISMHNVRPVEARQEPPQRLTIVQIHTPPPPTPTPKPAPPKPQPRVTHARPVSHPPHVSDKPDSKTVAAEPVASSAPGTPGPVASEAPGIGPPSSPAPTPSPSPKPMCSAPNVPAKALDVMNPSVPDGVDVTNATARVRVSLGADGVVQHVSIYQSAGNLLLDRAAMLAARQSTYRAEIRNCLPVTGDYLFTVDFQE